METIKFLVQGSSPEPYEVVFNNDEGKLTAYCSCPAGEHGTHCKHRVRILGGSSKDIVSDNKKDIETVLSWLPGTLLESAIKEFITTEKIYEKANKDFTNAKKILTTLFYNK